MTQPTETASPKRYTSGSVVGYLGADNDWYAADDVDRIVAALQEKLKVANNCIGGLGVNLRAAHKQANNLRAQLDQAQNEALSLREWHEAIMPYLEELLIAQPNVFGAGIEGDGYRCWPILAEFVTKGRDFLPPTPAEGSMT